MNEQEARPDTDMDIFDAPQLSAPKDKKDDDREIGIIRELSPKKVLDIIRMELRGFEYDWEKEMWVQKDHPLMNEKGINQFIWILKGAGVSDINTFSNYKDVDISPRVSYVLHEIIPTLHVYYKEYGIIKENLPIINVMLFNMCEGAFRKAMFAGDRGVINKTISESIISRAAGMQMQQQEEKKKGFFGRLFG